MSGNQFEIPKEMRSMAEASLDQARKAFESFISNAQQTAAAFGGASNRRSWCCRQGHQHQGDRFRGKERAGLAGLRAAAYPCKDLTEVMRLHTEYVQAQMRVLAEQASEMGQTVTRAAMDAAKPK